MAEYINQFPEQEARDNIDKQLVAAGWAVQEQDCWMSPNFQNTS
jgi:type I site-specific restriction endonuclease